MTKWILKTSQWLLIGLLLVSMGGHLALLQTFAWGKMMVDFSATTTLSEAVGKTFGGDHPCAMCKVVEKAKGEDEKKVLVKAEMKMELAVPIPVKVPAPDFTESGFTVTAYSGRFSEVFLAVPVRPPRDV